MYDKDNKLNENVLSLTSTPLLVSQEDNKKLQLFSVYDISI